MSGFKSLIPRDWQPDPGSTFGGSPSTILLVPEDHWRALGSPPNIEAYYEKLFEGAPCAGGLCWRCRGVLP